MDQLTPSTKPIHAAMWIGRDPTNRELASEFSNLYNLVAELQRQVTELEEQLEDQP